MASRRSTRSERLRVAVLMGGPSSEHEVSLLGGQNVVAALDSALFDVRPVVIARTGAWQVPARAATFAFDPRALDGWRSFENALAGILHLAEWPVDVVVPILHGRFGEDGTVQACLEAAGLPYVGSAPAASALALDKARTKDVLVCHGYRTPPYVELRAEDLRRGVAATAERLVEQFGTPLVLKDPLGGSSLEVQIADDAQEAAMALQALVPPARRVMAEAYVEGRELTAAVIHDRERGAPVALPIVEIRPRSSRSFDFHEKYSPEGAEELCPAPIPEAVEVEARRIGLAIHVLLGLAGLSRTDLMLDGQGALHVLEVNTLPGMTSTSLVPRAAAAAGMSFGDLVENLVRTAGLR